MNRLLAVQDQLQQTGAAIAGMEMVLAQNPDSRAAAANLRSLRKLHANLQDEFRDAADQYGRDVCIYRLFMERERPTATALAKALQGFQMALSLAYDALKNGPKDNRVVGSEILRHTELEVAYTFPGSFGVAFSLPNARLFEGFPSTLDEAIATVFEIAKADDTEKVAAVARQVGPATIAAMYDWARDNARHRTGALIEWRRQEAVRNSLTVQYPELQRLSETIEKTSVEETIEIAPRGILVGADTKTRRFHFVVEETDADIRGKFTDAISEQQAVLLPAKYTAVMRKTTKLRYSADKEEVSYFLVQLEPLSVEAMT